MEAGVSVADGGAILTDASYPNMKVWDNWVKEI